MKTENRKTKVFPLGFFGITTVIRGRTQDDPTEDPALQHSGFTSSGWDKCPLKFQSEGELDGDLSI